MNITYDCVGVQPFVSIPLLQREAFDVCKAGLRYECLHISNCHDDSSTLDRPGQAKPTQQSSSIVKDTPWHVHISPTLLQVAYLQFLKMVDGIFVQLLGDNVRK
jgi:hypothetical protein